MPRVAMAGSTAETAASTTALVLYGVALMANLPGIGTSEPYGFRLSVISPNYADGHPIETSILCKEMPGLIYTEFTTGIEM